MKHSCSICVKVIGCFSKVAAYSVQEICRASISNIASAVADTTNVLGLESFMLWLPGLQTYVWGWKKPVLLCVISVQITRQCALGACMCIAGTSMSYISGGSKGACNVCAKRMNI